MTNLPFPAVNSSSLTLIMCDTYPIGFSEPSGIQCARTAPMLYADASHDSISSFWGSK